ESRDRPLRDDPRRHRPVIAIDRGRMPGAIAFAATTALCILVIGCRAPATPPLRPVALPDVSRAAESVQSQLRERYDAMARATANPKASPGELAAAYGRMGMLLMAAEYRDPAEACLQNAEDLAPDEVKWPYYLAHLHGAAGDSTKSAA